MVSIVLIDFFSVNLGYVSEEQSERFHQDIRVMERRYQGRWDINMMANYYWPLQREVNQAIGNRRSIIRSLTDNRQRKFLQLDL